MTDLLFLAISLITLITAILSLESRELVYGAVALALSFLGVAAIFILLDAVYLAMFQILVYVGSISVLIVFVIMLVRREKWLTIKSGNERIVGIVTALSFFLVVGYISYNSGLSGINITNSSIPDFYDIGIQMINDYWLILEVTGLVLAVSVIGALTMAKLERNN